MILPPELISGVMTFADGQMLSRCACVSKEFNTIVNQEDLWKQALWQKFPHIQRTHDISAYFDNYKHAILDNNRKNRSAFAFHKIPVHSLGLNGWTSDRFTIEKYNFNFIIYPSNSVSLYLSFEPATLNSTSCCCLLKTRVISNNKLKKNRIFKLECHTLSTYHSMMGVKNLIPDALVNNFTHADHKGDKFFHIETEIIICYLTLNIFFKEDLDNGFHIIDYLNTPPSKSFTLFPKVTIYELVHDMLGIMSPIRLWILPISGSESDHQMPTPRLISQINMMDNIWSVFRYGVDELRRINIFIEKDIHIYPTITSGDTMFVKEWTPTGIRTMGFYNPANFGSQISLDQMIAYRIRMFKRFDHEYIFSEEMPIHNDKLIILFKKEYLDLFIDNHDKWVDECIDRCNNTKRDLTKMDLLDICHTFGLERPVGNNFHKLFKIYVNPKKVMKHLIEYNKLKK